MLRPYLLLCATLGACAEGKNDGGGVGGADAGRLADAGPRIDSGPLPDGGDVPGGDVTLSQSTSTTVMDEHALGCFDGFGNFPYSYYRVFDLAQEGITTPLMVTSVSSGIEFAEGGDGPQPATIVLHTLTGDFVLANLTEIASAEVTVTDQTLSVLEVPISATVPASSTLVVELRIPDGAEAGDFLFPGTNDDGQSAPTFASWPECQVNEPTSLADLDAPDVHWVLSVDGTK